MSEKGPDIANKSTSIKRERGSSNIFFYFLLASFISTLIIDGFAQFSHYVLLITTPLFAFFFILLIYSNKGSQDSLPFYDVFIIALGLALVISIFLYCTYTAVLNLISWVYNTLLTKELNLTLTIIITFLTGLSLFYFRLKYRSVYGFTETLVGLIVAATRVANESPAEHFNYNFYIALLTAGVYLVVRGLDNIHQGIMKEPYDSIALKVRIALDLFGKSFRGSVKVTNSTNEIEAQTKSLSSVPVFFSYNSEYFYFPDDVLYHYPAR